MNEPASRNKQPYIAILVFRSSGTPPLFSEDFVLLHAASEDEAHRKAVEHGRQRETSYPNACGDEVAWTLEHVVDVGAVLDDDLTSDADLYSRHFTDITAYESFEPKLSGEEL